MSLVNYYIGLQCYYKQTVCFTAISVTLVFMILGWLYIRQSCEDNNMSSILLLSITILTNNTMVN